VLVVDVFTYMGKLFFWPLTNYIPQKGCTLVQHHECRDYDHVIIARVT